ncbi:MAG: lysophospholipase [Leptospiraceae bacterium]|nr:lysophospholipase [Leptospiraceae bacterium]MDW8306182.1 alpha/beta fold hydrolase [Leptospiraceae bacterium]
MFFIVLNCNSLFYYPDKVLYEDPFALGFHLREIHIHRFDGKKLAAWFFLTKEKPRGTVLQLHGNAQNMSSHYRLLSWVLEHGFHLFTFDYQGYGLSEGNPSPEGTIEDALAAFRQLLTIKEAHNLPIIIYGQSLGGKVAQDFLAFLHAEELAQIGGVILEGSFSSYQKLAAEKMREGILSYPLFPLAYLLIKDPPIPEPKGKLPPFLIIHGTHDMVVSYKNAKELAEKYDAPLLTLQGGSHLDPMTYRDPIYRQEILGYLDYFSNRLR